MNQQKFDEVLEHAQLRSRNVMSKKHDEYTTPDERFANFKQAVGLSYHNIPEKVAWEMMVKHLQSLKDIISNVEKGILPSVETLDEKCGDIHNYLYLLEGMIIERKNIEP